MLVSRVNQADSAYDAALNALPDATDEDGGAASSHRTARAGVWHDRGVCALRCAALYDQLSQTDEARYSTTGKGEGGALASCVFCFAGRL